jgi:hypothetical protein
MNFSPLRNVETDMEHLVQGFWDLITSLSSNGFAAAPGYRRGKALLGNASRWENQVFAGSGRHAEMPGKGVDLVYRFR